MLRALAGGIAGLGRALAEHWDAVEADFARYYRADLGAVLFGRRPWSLRRIFALLRHLPVESSFVASLHYAEAASRRSPEVVVGDFGSAARMMKGA